MNAMLLTFPDDEQKPASAVEQGRRLMQRTLGSGYAQNHNNPWFTAYVCMLTHMHEHIDVRDIIGTLPYRDAMDEESFQQALSLHQITLSLLSASNLHEEGFPLLRYNSKGIVTHVLLGRESEMFNTIDCMRGEYSLESPELLGQGYIFKVIHKTSEEKQEEKQVEQSSGHGWFRNMLDRFHAQFTKLFFVSFLLNLFSLIIPILVMITYDRVVAAQASHDLQYLAVGFAVALGVEATLRLVRARHIAWLGTRIDTINTHSIIGQLLRLPASMVERASVASQIARIKSLSEIREFFTGPLFLTCIELPFTLLLLGTLALIGGTLALVPIIAATGYIAFFLVLRAHTRRTMFKAARSHAQLEQATLETFHQMEALRTGAMQDSWQAHMDQLSAQASKATFHAAFLSSTLENIAYATTSLAGLATLFLGVGHVLAGELTAGALIACMILVWRTLAPLSSICTMLPRLEQMRQSIGQINRLMDMQAERDRDPNDKARLKSHGRIALTNVGIRYNRDADPVFAGMNLEVAKGQSVAIMGGNGSGKSTLLKLVLGLYQPQAGTVQIDGVDIRQFRTSDLRRTCAYIAQNPDFYTGTIAENMRIACPEASDDEIEQALAEVGLSTTIEELPNSIHTWIDCSDSEGTPTLLSYRINLARACLSNAPIILCDELPFALMQDEEGMHFLKLLESWQGKRTVLFVTHREDLAASANIVVGLRRGRTPLIGDPETVLPIIKEENYAAHSARAS